MPDDISQAPVEPIIPQEEVAENATAQVSTQEQPQTEKPLTLDDVRGLFKDEVLPVIQSQVAKGENRINQRIQERFAALELTKGALKLTDEQVQTVQQDIIREEQMNAFKAEPQASGQKQTPPNELVASQVDFVYSQINATFNEVGTDVTPNDAEWKTLEAALNDPKGSLAKTLIAANKAAEAKSVRVASQQKKASARVTSTGGEQNQSEIQPLSAEDKISKGLKDKVWHSQEPASRT